MAPAASDICKPQQVHALKDAVLKVIEMGARAIHSRDYRARSRKRELNQPVRNVFHQVAT